MYDHERVPVWLRRQMQRRLGSGADVRTIQRIAEAVSSRSRVAQGSSSTEPASSAVGSNVIPFPSQSALLGESADRRVC
jgi:hypothetical protein